MKKQKRQALLREANNTILRLRQQLAEEIRANETLVPAYNRLKRQNAELVLANNSLTEQILRHISESPLQDFVEE